VHKDPILQAVGAGRLQLPTLLTEALAANERVKYLLTLLQSARASADGAQGLGDMHQERVACGVQDDTLDGVVSGSRTSVDGIYEIPAAEAIVGQVLRELDTMLAPLSEVGNGRAAALKERKHRIADALRTDGDRLRREDVELLTAPPSECGDSAHTVVMDAHRALNALETQIATESIDGAHAYGLQDGDRRLLRDFMRGLQRTERLRLDHPGLGTTSTRSGSTLLIENDLGETAAHIVVIRIEGLRVTITYTDVHLQRLVFLQSLLLAWGVTWADTHTRSDHALGGGLYHLASGRFDAANEAELGEFLEHLGSRMVFLIDWNRARKRLRRLLGGGAAIQLLTWAAEHEYGQIPFLRAGGDRLVYDAMQFAGARFGRSGGSLSGLLGADDAFALMQSVLRICTTELLAGHPISLLQDEVRAELAGHLRSARQEALALVLRHAEISVEIAELARDALDHTILDEDSARDAEAAAQLEREADLLVEEVRTAASRSTELRHLLQLIAAADDIADCLEEATFHATLLSPGSPKGDLRGHMRELTRLVLESVRAYLRGAALTTELEHADPLGEETDALLAAAHESIALEHATDELQRVIHKALVADVSLPASELFATVQLTDSFEQAADALMHSAHLLREHALERVVGSEPLAAETTRARDRPTGTSPIRPDSDVYVVGDMGEPIPEASVIGAKAHGLARLARAGMPVPEAVVLKTTIAAAAGEAFAQDRVKRAVTNAVGALEGLAGLTLGSRRNPLLLSVRSGAPVSMPGMLETVLNVGMCDSALRGLVQTTGNPRLGWDTYRRFVESFACVVHGCPRAPFAAELGERLAAAGASSPRELSAHELERVTRGHMGLFERITGQALPQDPRAQVLSAVAAVLRSSDAPKARRYRELRGIPNEPGTAVILQRMVFGNAGGISGSGVGFTRDPSLGVHELYLDFLLDAQGEDIVAGHETVEGAGRLAAAAPELLKEIDAIAAKLELEFGDAQEFELTVQDGELFLLQTRTAKRTSWAALRMAVDQVHEGVITPEAALARLDGLELETLKRRRVKDPGELHVLGRGVPASGGVAVGPVALDGEAVERIATEGSAPVLVRPETTTADLAALAPAAGLLTRVGSRTSHAAVVARELDKPCLVGCQELKFDLDERAVRIGGQRLGEGELICVDADSGRVFAGAPEIVEDRPEQELEEITGWRAQAAGDAPAHGR